MNYNLEKVYPTPRPPGRTPLFEKRGELLGRALILHPPKSPTSTSSALASKGDFFNLNTKYRLSPNLTSSL